MESFCRELIKLEKADISKKTVLWNLLQKYLYEFSVFYQDTIEEDGNYAYPYFNSFFTEPDREAWLIRTNGKLAGFLLLNRYSVTGEEIDFAVAEFCILPIYRRNYLGKQTMEQIFETHRGRWQIKYNRRNPAAEKFWNEITDGYEKKIRLLTDEDRVICFRNDR